jgi:hypothetical protein
MTYLKGTNRLVHSYKRFRLSRFSDLEIDRDYAAHPRFNLTGRAGAVFLFDANGLHKGNRRLGAVRDAVIHVYSTGRNRAAMKIPRTYLDGLTPAQRAVVLNNDVVEVT